MGVRFDVIALVIQEETASVALSNRICVFGIAQQSWITSLRWKLSGENYNLATPAGTCPRIKPSPPT